MLEKVKNLGCNTAAKILSVNKSTVIRWRKELIKEANSLDDKLEELNQKMKSEAESTKEETISN